MNIMVTGAAGFIGRHLCRSLCAEGHRVLGVDSFVTSPESGAAELAGEGVEFLKMDVRDAALAEIGRRFRPERIYHLACPTGVHNLVPLAFDMLDTCYRGTLQVLEVAQQQDAAVLLASSAEVYGDPLVSPQPETYTGNVDQLGPRNGYEEGKRVAESLVAIFVQRRWARGGIARIFNTYGPGMAETDTRVVPAMLRHAMRGEPLVVYGDGSQTRCHSYVEDTVRGLKLVLERGESGRPYNIGASDQVSILALAQVVQEVTDSPSTVEFRPHFVPDHQQRLPDVTRARVELGWETTVGLREGLKRTARTMLGTPPA